MRNALKVKRRVNWTCFRDERSNCDNWSWKACLKDWRNEMKTWVVNEAKWREVEVN